MKLLQSYISSLPTYDANSRIMKEGLLFLILVAPSFISKIIKEYIYAYSSGSINNITPLDIKKMRSVIANHMTVEKELVATVIAMQPGLRETITNFFEVLT